MAFGFREKLSPQTALCILLALAGIGLLFKGSDGSTLNITGTVLVMVSALSYAIYIVGVNQMCIRDRFFRLSTLLFSGCFYYLYAR